MLAAVLLTSKEVIAGDTNSLFKANELSVGISSGYTIDRAAAFEKPYDFNFNVHAGYFITKHIGLEVSAPFYNSERVGFSEVQGGVVIRVPVLKYFAPYVGASAVYGLKDVTDKWAYVARAGVEGRINSKWGVFVEGNYRNDQIDGFKLQDGGTSVLGGLRLVF